MYKTIVSQSVWRTTIYVYVVHRHIELARTIHLEHTMGTMSTKSRIPNSIESSLDSAQCS